MSLRTRRIWYGRKKRVDARSTFFSTIYGGLHAPFRRFNDNEFSPNR